MNTTTPSREDVARRAEELWKAEGCPGGRDTEFWLEAERQLTSSNTATPSPSGNAQDRGNGNSQTSPTGGPSQAPDPKAPEDAHPQASTVMPAADEAKSVQQKKSARAPKSPTKTAPKPAPAETGKPLWKKPHSS